MKMTIIRDEVQLLVECEACGHQFWIEGPKEKERLMPELLAGTKCPKCEEVLDLVVDERP